MVLWIVAFLLAAGLGVVGFYQGALRVAFSFVGLLLAALLAGVVGMVFNIILPPLGLSHPAILAFISPILGFLVILTLCKIAGYAVHKKVDTWYKYKGSDTERLLYERLNSRVGIAFGLANGYLYLLILCSFVYTLGYFSYQVATDRNESFWVRTINNLCKDIETTGMGKSIAPLNRATETYFDSADIVADLFHSPLLQNRLANYPPLLLVGERPEFKPFNDPKLQEQWASGMSLREFASHEAIKPVIQNRELFTNVLGLVQPDLKDLKTYLETGTSPKFDEEKILGRWQFNFRSSVLEARKRKPTMGSRELTVLRKALANAFANATFIATVDNQAILRLQGKETKGTWKSAGGGQYILTVSEGGGEVKAYVDGKHVTFVRDGIPLVFDNTRV
jgi:Colicin V production protein